MTFYDPRERMVVVALQMIGGREHIVGVTDVRLAERTLEDGARDLLTDVVRRRRAA
jgi:hypothetical protein